MSDNYSYTVQKAIEKELDSSVSSLGGFYTDPNHYTKGSLAGTRMISDKSKDAASDDKITLIGSDDGTTFWTLYGTWEDRTNGSILVDFSPKGGPSDLSATYSCSEDDGCKITW
jgi:hypothetical protein